MEKLRKFFIAGMLITPTMLSADQTTTANSSASVKAPIHNTMKENPISKEKSVVSHRHRKKKIHTEKES